MSGYRHPAMRRWDDLRQECRETFGRRSGPGGQHRNKVETAAVIEHLPTGIRAEATERRSQAQNRTVAQHRLRIALALQHRPETSPGADELRAVVGPYTTNKGLSISARHDDFPGIVAAVIESLHQHNYRLADAAAMLHISTGQLSRFLKKHREVWQHVNQARQAKGLKPLR